MLTKDTSVENTTSPPTHKRGKSMKSVGRNFYIEEAAEELRADDLARSPRFGTMLESEISLRVPKDS